MAVEFNGGVGHGAHDVAPQVAMSALLTHALPQRWNPELQAKSQVVPSHVGVAFAGTMHGEHDMPQDATLALLAHEPPVPPPHTWNPMLHVKPHDVPSHVGVALGGVGHGVQPIPQKFKSRFDTQRPPHRWKPGRQTKPQAPSAQVSRPFGGAGHARPHIPQLSGSDSGSTQLPPQRNSAVPQPVTHAHVVPMARHTGVPPLHVRPHVPQFADEFRAVSHPSIRSELQSAKPGSQATPHVIPSQVATAFALAGHGMQPVPHDKMSRSERHDVPHR